MFGYSFLGGRSLDGKCGLKVGLSAACYDTNAVKTLHISVVLNNFVARMGLEQACYPALTPQIP
jgi:hypothetical protein